jgi:uncharacterized iron-regulated membrane protein
MDKKNSLRQSMDYLHTWAGVLFSALLFLVFFMGTLSVFDREIDRWMMPSTRVSMPDQISFDRIAKPHLEKLAPGSKQWTVQYPSEREPVMRISWLEGDEFKKRFVDVNTGQLLPDVGTKGATGFFFPFHYSFHIKWKNIGYWLLAVVSIVMLALLVSGVIIHKKIFQDFFTFRPKKSTHRATLDLHNASSVLLLPFHFIVTLSGLIIFVFIYMNPGIEMVYGKGNKKLSEEIFDLRAATPPREGRELASIDRMVADAQATWGGGTVRRINIRDPQGDKTSIDIQRLPLDRITYETFTIHFDPVSGAILHRQSPSAALKVQRFFSGLHMIPFDHWWLRWMYFVMGLISCVMIGTGFLLWVEKRRIRQEKEGRCSYRIVNAVAVAATFGVVLATLAMLVANKVLPGELPKRELVEQLVFFGVWIAALAHSLARAIYMRFQSDIRTAWREQAWACVGLALAAVTLNALMTGDHLFHTIRQGDFAVAGTDLVLLASAGLAAVVARRLPGRHVAAFGHLEAAKGAAA